jgi:hypothetical protein
MPGCKTARIAIAVPVQPLSSLWLNTHPKTQPVCRTLLRQVGASLQRGVIEDHDSVALQGLSVTMVRTRARTLNATVGFHRWDLERIYH